MVLFLGALMMISDAKNIAQLKEEGIQLSKRESSTCGGSGRKINNFFYHH